MDSCYIFPYYRRKTYQFLAKRSFLQSLPTRSDCVEPKCSPLMTTLVPGLPSLGLIPVTTGAGRGIFANLTTTLYISEHMWISFRQNKRKLKHFYCNNFNQFVFELIQLSAISASHQFQQFSRGR